MVEKGYILCVDDDLAILEQLWQQIVDLTSATHEVVMASSGEEALQTLYDLHHQGKTVEMVIADLVMPGMSGDRLLEIVHAQFPFIIKVLLTGYTGLDSALYCINNANLDKYISKPWQTEDLHLTVTSLLRQFRLRRDNESLVENLQLRNLQLKSALRELRKAKKEIETSYIQTLQSLAAALDAKDPYTAGHSERVARWSSMIGRRLNLGREEIEDIRSVALLHDIGKIGMPEKVLNKSGRLTTEEMDMVRMHPIIGAQILEPIVSFARYVPIVRHHHEWYNGKGYPDGLRGSDLPLAVWIIALADAFDAMTSNRPYRKMQSLDFAYEQMIGGMNTQFNPECVRVFMDLLREPGFSYEETVRLGKARRQRNALPDPMQAALQHIVDSGGIVQSCSAMVKEYDNQGGGGEKNENPEKADGQTEKGASADEGADNERSDARQATPSGRGTGGP